MFLIISFLPLSVFQMHSLIHRFYITYFTWVNLVQIWWLQVLCPCSNGICYYNLDMLFFEKRIWDDCKYAVAFHSIRKTPTWSVYCKLDRFLLKKTGFIYLPFCYFSFSTPTIHQTDILSRRFLWRMCHQMLMNPSAKLLSISFLSTIPITI